ncbi:hypothetical protein [uncultured Mediterranean phage uvMED]|nr:hypothetical protein [uncultured Mediterranean phage uvMED]
MPSQIQVDKIQSANGATTYLDNGTLSNLNFPSGHVIQLVHPTPATETNALTTSYVNLHEVSITLKGGNSKIFIHHGWQYYSASGTGVGFQIYKDTSSGVSTSDTLLAPVGIVDTVGPLHYYASGGSLYQSAHYSVVDDVTSNNSGDTIYYGFFYRKRDGSATVPPDGSNVDGYFITTLMELTS